MHPRRPLLALACTLTAALATATAQAKPPSLDRLFPAGGRQGETPEVKAEGSFDPWPVKAWVSGTGVEFSIAPDPEKGKGKLVAHIAADATPGLRWVRLYNDEGASALRPFLVGTLPEVDEVEPNDGPKAWQAIDQPAVVINGRLAKNGDVDGYQIELKRGQTLVAAVEANGRLGSPMDGVLQITSPAGFVLAQVDDSPDRDPRIIFKARSDGRHIVRLFAFPATPDQRIGFSGGDAYVYRLTLTTGGYIDHAAPLAVPRGATGEVELVGWNLPDEARTISIPADLPDGAAELSHPAVANTTSLKVEPTETRIIKEAEPATLAHPQALELPALVSGGIGAAREVDCYAFALKKGEKINIRVESRVLGYPLDAALRVLNSDGNPLAESDDSGGGRRGGAAARDPRLEFTAPADGTYRVTVRDVYAKGGPSHAYLLSLGPPRAEARLQLKADTLAVGPGKPLKVPVEVARIGGFDEPIELTVEGLPPAVKAEPAVSEPTGDRSKAVELTLMSQGDATWAGPIRIVGRATKSGARITATAPIAGLDDERTADLWLNQVKVAPPDPPAAEKKAD